jgi:hypothetical protein
MYFLTLLHLHRGPFCRALMLGPKNLPNSRYAASIASLTGVNKTALLSLCKLMFNFSLGCSGDNKYSPGTICTPTR